MAVRIQGRRFREHRPDLAQAAQEGDEDAQRLLNGAWIYLADAISQVIVLLCHEDREGVFELLERRGMEPVNDPAELARLVAS